jgi:hypothetical protein
MHDVPNATNLEGKHPMDSLLCDLLVTPLPTEGTDIMGNRHEISIRSVVLTPAGGRPCFSLYFHETCHVNMALAVWTVSAARGLLLEPYGMWPSE